MPLFLKSLLASRKFWVAVFGLVQTIVFQFFPQFPKEVWMAIDALCAVVIGSIAVEDANQYPSARERKIAALVGKITPDLLAEYSFGAGGHLNGEDSGSKGQTEPIESSEPTDSTRGAD